MGYVIFLIINLIFITIIDLIHHCYHQIHHTTRQSDHNRHVTIILLSILTTNPIRKPGIMKDFHGTLLTRKTHRNTIELPPPSPRRLANVATDDYVKSACFDNFRLTGARLATNDSNKKMSKRRVTLNAINTQARPQSPQFEKVRIRKYDESLPAVTTGIKSFVHN